MYDSNLQKQHKPIQQWFFPQKHEHFYQDFRSVPFNLLIFAQLLLLDLFMPRAQPLWLQLHALCGYWTQCKKKFLLCRDLRTQDLPSWRLSFFFLSYFSLVLLRQSCKFCCGREIYNTWHKISCYPVQLHIFGDWSTPHWNQWVVLHWIQ